MRSVLGFLFGVGASTALVYWLLTPASTPQRPQPAAVPLAMRIPSSSLVPSPAPTAVTASLPAGTAQPAETATATETALAARLRDTHTWSELLLVSAGAVRTLRPPDAVDRTVFPVTDGQRLYAYLRPAGAAGKRIVAFDLEGREAETITDSTRLVEPRGLVATPDGAAFLFFLDDRTSSRTELWAYDTISRAKRVVVERLNRDTLHGPFFSPDGSFLLVSGDRFLASSPHRTGADILRVPVFGSTVRWDAGAARSPDGERVALVVEAGDGRAPLQRVVEYSLRTDTSRVRFSVTRGGVRILRWRDPDDLLLVTGSAEGTGGPETQEEALPRRPTVWILRGDQRLPVHLGSAVQEPLISGAGDTIAYIRGAREDVTIDLLDVKTGVPRALAALTLSDPPNAPASAAETAHSYVRVLQILERTPRAAVPVRGVPAGGPASAVLEFVSRQIREVSDALSGEYAAPERVWKLATPDLYYVDYRVGSTLWRRLVRAQMADGRLTGLSVEGVFAPVEGRWVIARGQDAPMPDPVSLYEFEPDINRWVEKPIGQGGLP